MGNEDSWERRGKVGLSFVRASNNLGRREFFLLLGFEGNDVAIEHKIVAVLCLVAVVAPTMGVAGVRKEKVVQCAPTMARAVELLIPANVHFHGNGFEEWIGAPLQS